MKGLDIRIVGGMGGGIYLDAGVLATTVDGLQARRVDNGKEIADIIVRVNGVQPFKGSRVPHLRLVSCVQY